MLVPVPPPTYTLAPMLPELADGQRAALDACLTALTGRVASVLVTGVGTTMGHHMIELATPAGSVLVMERVQPQAA